MGYHAKILEDGQILLPAELGRELGLKAGDVVRVDRAGGDFVLTVETPAGTPRERLLAAMRNYSVDDFLADRAEDWRE